MEHWNRQLHQIYLYTISHVVNRRYFNMTVNYRGRNLSAPAFFIIRYNRRGIDREKVDFPTPALSYKISTILDSIVFGCYPSEHKKKKWKN